MAIYVKQVQKALTVADNIPEKSIADTKKIEKQKVDELSATVRYMQSHGNDLIKI